jgi:hypothetical protein
MNATRTLLVVAVLAGAGAAQVAWGPRPSGFAPPGRSDFEMAYDPLRHRTVVFGGAAGDVLPDDTWEWDGATWTQHITNPAPAATFWGAMAFDGSSGCVLLFGGMNSSAQTLGETWAWDGLAWRQLHPPTHPPARVGHAMVWDGARGRLLLVGGADRANMPFGDTWEWDGQDWQLRHPANSPPARHDHALAFDARRGRVMLYGGATRTAVLGDVWEWDGVDWAQRAAVAAPGPRTDLALSFDSRRGRTVLFGGAHLEILGDTWEWDGDRWLQRSPCASPSPRGGHATVFDEIQGTIVMFGGFDGANFPSDVWEYHNLTPAEFEEFGRGCPGAVGAPDLTRAEWTGAWLGESLTFVLDSIPAAPTSVPFLLLGTSDEWVGGQPLPLLLDPIGMPGCGLWIAPDLLTAPMPRVGPGAELAVPIPNDLRLVRAPFFAQAFVTELGANPLGVTASNGAIATIGAK